MDMIDSKQLVLAFIEGLGLILSPCILPVLPFVLATSLGGGKARPLGVIAGFVAAFTAFAILSRQAILAAGIDGDLLRHAALVALALLGIIMLVPSLSAFLTQKLEGVARLGARWTDRTQAQQGFAGGVAIGALIGLVWTPCAGPILAAAVIQVVQAQSTVAAAITLGAFAAGAGLPMLMITLLGRRALDRLSFIKKHAAGLRQCLGVIIIAMAALVYTGADVRWLAALDMPAPGSISSIDPDSGLQDGLAAPYPAPEITGIDSWINSPPLKLQDLKGKVVLIDFWTYSCINCVRTMPYLTAWDKKYREAGLVIIGMHAPEFAFEKKRANVEKAVALHGIRYPVALDNDLATWSAFRNQYWPAHYLIDREGRVVYTHFGEGRYDVTEHNIRTLLGIRGEDVRVEAADGTVAGQSPETYLGFARARNIDDLVAGEKSYRFPETLPLHNWALSGGWRTGGQSITSLSADAALRYHFAAGTVYLVMGTADGQPVEVETIIDGVPGPVINVDHETLYTVAKLPAPRTGILELRPHRAGLVAYAFTFGR